jgi:aspartyl/asparaginyl-tRNA synthetase
MAIERAHLEARNLIDGMLKHVFRSILQNHQPELDNIKLQFPRDDLVFPDDKVILDFHDGIRLPKDDGWTEHGEELDEYEDLSRHAEVRLGQSVKEIYILGMLIFFLYCTDN